MTKEGENQTIGEIVRGFSLGQFQGGTVYFKHFGLLDSFGIDKVFDETYIYAQKQGVKTEAEALVEAMGGDMWKESDEKSVVEKEYELKVKKSSVSKMPLQSQVDQRLIEISNLETEIEILKKVRKAALGKTAEEFATKRSNEVFIFKSCFLDEAFSRPLFDFDEFENLPGRLLEELVCEYNLKFGKFASHGIKKAAISPNILNLIALSKSPTEFYGKPLVSLTFYQVEMLNWGKYYFSIFSNSDKIPDDCKTDPEKLEAWFNTSRNMQEKFAAKDDEHVRGTSLSSAPGAKASDYEKAGVGKPRGLASMIKAQVKDGGSLDRQAFGDLIK